MSWTVRRMTAGDIDAVFTLARTIPEAPDWSCAAYENYTATQSSDPLLRAAFIAEAGGHLLGFVAGRLVAGVCELESIAVVAKARRQGIAAALLQAFLGWAQGHKAVRLELEVRASNARAISFYGKYGLRREGLRAGYYQSPQEDAVLMGMDLQTGGNLS